MTKGRPSSPICFQLGIIRLSDKDVRKPTRIPTILPAPSRHNTEIINWIVQVVNGKATFLNQNIPIHYYSSL